eukprot:gnl/Hemi2/28584_TR9469_c0_g1_i1.p1 gnl/Hemi2/28584_TR9469_c0_g1~~gnl/Hemi2/28584_TR9469_c0_g1_i1.p1  ORF type:complete len:553 (+),score=107.63 gnl/Hemi2/28584_TR9469_c0_g1_i1:98-1756(+)
MKRTRGMGTAPWGKRARAESDERDDFNRFEPGPFQLSRVRCLLADLGAVLIEPDKTATICLDANTTFRIATKKELKGIPGPHKTLFLRTPATTEVTETEELIVRRFLEHGTVARISTIDTGNHRCWFVEFAEAAAAVAASEECKLYFAVPVDKQSRARKFFLPLPKDFCMNVVPELPLSHAEGREHCIVFGNCTMPEYVRLKAYHHVEHHVEHHQLKHTIRSFGSSTVSFMRKNALEGSDVVRLDTATRDVEVLHSFKEECCLFYELYEHYLVCGFYEKVFFKNLATGEVIQQPASSSVNCASFFHHRGTAFLLLSNNEGAIWVVHLPSFAKVTRVQVPGNPINCVKVSPDGKHMVAVGDRPFLHFFDTTFSPTEGVTFIKNSDEQLFATENIGAGGASLCFDDFSTQVAVATEHGVLYVYRLKPRTALSCFLPCLSPLRAVAFSPGAQPLLAFISDHSFHVVDLQTMVGETFSRSKHYLASGVSFSPTGDSIYVGCGTCIEEYSILRRHCLIDLCINKIVLNKHNWIDYETRYGWCFEDLPEELRCRIENA